MAESNVRPACLSTSKPLPPLPSSLPPQDASLSSNDGGGEGGDEGDELDGLGEKTGPAIRQAEPPWPPVGSPDYILTAAYMLIFVELAWLILWLLRSLQS